DGDELILRRARGSRYASFGDPEAQPGDVWHLAADPRQAFITLEVDSQAATLPSKRLRHLALRVTQVTGSLTIRRKTEARNAFGRPAEGLATIIDQAPTAFIRETVANPPRGQDAIQPLAIRRRFLASTETGPAQGESATFYPPEGQPVELTVLHVTQVAGNLWELELA
ncbi:hypothetical protein, partial [Desulfuromonas sp. CSMB_57]|uniref:hypothetical protein n=1 Tax=Desulfuromonas sp. CSMB_57 TaxID=2807629 RepID=UPI0020BEC1CF